MLNSFNKVINIGKRTIGDGHRPYVIAEMACAHDGDINKAKRLVKAAADAKADAIQLQFFSLHDVIVPTHEIFPILKKICFNEEEWTDIFNYCRKFNIDVFVCTYDVPSAKLAIKLKADGIKLNSSDLNNPEVVIAVAKSGIPFTLGTGASTLEEIRNGLELSADNGAKDVVLMHGVQNFPTKNEDLNISRIQLLKDTFGLPAGYHDHTAGDDPFTMMIDLIAIGLGANVIEKHITEDRSEKGLDYQAALEPKEYIEFVKRIHHAYQAYGDKVPKPFTESDLKYRKFQKKSIVSLNSISKGTTITRDLVYFTRNIDPGTAPINFHQIEGKKSINDIEQYQNITEKDVE